MVVGGVAVFRLVSLAAGTLVPGYSVRGDYVSSLAGRGSSVAVFGIAAIAALGIAHLGAAAVWRGAVAVPLALAGAAAQSTSTARTDSSSPVAGRPSSFSRSSEGRANRPDAMRSCTKPMPPSSADGTAR